MPRFRTLIATAAITGAILAVPSTAATASTGVTRTGNCSGLADWKLKVGPDNGRLEVEFEVDSNRAGQVWRVRILDNGVLRFNALRTTRAPSGSFTVVRRIPNMAGTDHILARARNVRSGQLCIAKLSV